MKYMFPIVAIALQCFSISTAQTQDVDPPRIEDDNPEIASQRATEGSARDQLLAGIYYFEGKSGIEKNIPEAIKWIRKSADQDFAEAEYLLAALYINGEYLPVDMDQAIKWLGRSSEHHFAPAQHLLALTILLKPGRSEQEALEAEKWFILSAAQGHVEAQVHLAQAYASGNGVRKSLSHSQFWYREAAKNGSEKAQTVLRNLGWD